MQKPRRFLIMPCKNLCGRYRAPRPKASRYFVTQGRYEIGQKRCQVCEIFLKWEGIRCPCCNSTLRTRPHPKKYREKFAPKDRR